jgi:hypothetical protein
MILGSKIPVENIIYTYRTKVPYEYMLKPIGYLERIAGSRSEAMTIFKNTIYFLINHTND